MFVLHRDLDDTVALGAFRLVDLDGEAALDRFLQILDLARGRCYQSAARDPRRVLAPPRTGARRGFTPTRRRRPCRTAARGTSRGRRPTGSGSESFFASLKGELIDRQRWPTRRTARQASFEWLEVFSNRQRRHSALGNWNPVARGRPSCWNADTLRAIVSAFAARPSSPG